MACTLVEKEEMYMRDGLHLSGKAAPVLDDGLKRAVDSGLDKVRYLNYMGRGLQRRLKTDKGLTELR